MGYVEDNLYVLPEEEQKRFKGYIRNVETNLLNKVNITPEEREEYLEVLKIYEFYTKVTQLCIDRHKECVADVNKYKKLYETEPSDKKAEIYLQKLIELKEVEKKAYAKYEQVNAIRRSYEPDKERVLKALEQKLRQQYDEKKNPNNGGRK